MPQCSLGNIKIHVEVPLFLVFFAFMMEIPVTTNLIMYRTCYLLLGFNQSDCALLGTNYTDNATAKLEEEVQPHATIILMSRSIMEAIVPPVLCFFSGPWSDKYGRKPVLLTGIGGYIMAFLIMTTISALPNASPWFFMVSLVPFFISGGFPSLFAAMLSYITDVTSEENRGVRMGVFEAILTIGVLAGTLSSSFILNAYGYIAIYSVSTLCVVLAFVFTLFLIPESVVIVETEGKLRKLFQFSLAKETLTTTFKRRENNDRFLLLAIISLMVIFLIASLAEANVVFLYLRDKFHWSLEIFTFYTSVNNAAWVMGSFVGAYVLNKLLHVGEIVIILLGLLSTSFSSVALGLATKGWQVYASGVSKCLGGAVSPMARSLLSKLVSGEDAGKIFSVVTALEAVGVFLGAPIYTFVYNSTLLTFPGAFNFVTVGILGFDVVLIIVIFILQSRNQIEYRNLNHSEEEEQDQGNAVT